LVITTLNYNYSYSSSKLIIRKDESLRGLYRPKTYLHTPKIRPTINAATTSVTATERHTMVLTQVLQLELISLKMNCNLKVKNYIKYKDLPATVVPVWSSQWTGGGGVGVGVVSRSMNREPSTGRDKAPVLFIYFATASTIVTAEVY